MDQLFADIAKKQDQYYASIKEKAFEFISDNFYRPEQLENLESVRRQISVLKEASDTKVKSALHYHIRGIREGLTELHNSKNSIKQLDENLSFINQQMLEFSNIEAKIKVVKNTASNLNCLTESLNLLNQLFGIPDTITNTKNYIEGGHYLEAHFNIRNLENIRDNLFIEHHKKSYHTYSKNSVDWPLATYFVDLSALFNTLFEKIEHTIINYRQSASDSPSTLVTALRIIEREESVDKYWMEENRNGLAMMVPKRPKNAKKIVMDHLESAVKNRITSTLDDMDPSDKFHVTKLLERIRNIVVSELLLIQDHVVPCFPPSYNILACFTSWFHNAIIVTVEMLISKWKDTNLDINNSISVLIWARDYKNSSFFGNPDFAKAIHMTIQKSPSVLTEQLEKKLYDHYVASLYKTMNEWTKRMVQIESKDWRQSTTKPDLHSGIYQTMLPTLLTQMLLPNLESAGSFSFEIKQRAYKGCLQAIESLIIDYTSHYETYCQEHFNPEKMLENTTNTEAELLPSSDGYHLFTDYTIAIADNCQSILDSINLLTNTANKDDSPKNYNKGEVHFSKTPTGIEITNDNNERIISINRALKQLANMACQMLVTDFMKAMQPAFDNLFTKNWQQNYSSWSEGFFEALNDFSSILSYMVFNYRIVVFKSIDQQVSIQYLKALIMRKLKFSNNQDRVHAVKQIQRDSCKLIDFFKENTETDDLEDLFSLGISLCVGLVSVMDITFVRFDLNKIAHLYSDFTEQHATAILQSRGDMTRDDIRNKIKEVDFEETSSTATRQGLFKNINVESILNKLANLTFNK